MAYQLGIPGATFPQWETIAQQNHFDEFTDFENSRPLGRKEFLAALSPQFTDKVSPIKFPT